MPINFPIISNTNILDLDSGLIKSPSSDLFSGLDALNQNQQEYHYETIFTILETLPGVAGVFTSIKDYTTKFEVIIPGKIRKGLADGSIDFSKRKGGMRELFAEVRKKDGTIFQKLNIAEIADAGKITQLLNSTQLLQIQQGISNLSRKLEALSEKVGELQLEFNYDRIGTVQAGYELFLLALQTQDGVTRNYYLREAITNLLLGRAQLIEAANSSLKKITQYSTSDWSRFLNEVTKDGSFHKEQTELVSTFRNHLVYVQRASQLIIHSLILTGANDKAVIQSVSSFKNFIEGVNNSKALECLAQWEPNEKINWEDSISETVSAIIQFQSIGLANSSKFLITTEKSN